MEYKLDVKNEGYDSSTLNVLSSDPSIATIELRDDGYYLVMTNDEITDYATDGGKDFTLTVSASKLDEFGQTSETSATLQLTMLEYVINRLPNSEDEDLIEGMNGGVVTSAVGERTELSFNFDEMLEYNPSNQSVLNKLSVFIESLKENGSWTYYTDLNANNNEGVQIYPTPLQKDKSTKSTVTTNDNISTRYLSTSGFSFTTNVAHDPTNRHYFFSYSGQYKVQSGQYVWTGRVSRDYPEGYEVIDVEIDVYSFLRGSEESPNPIYLRIGFRPVEHHRKQCKIKQRAERPRPRSEPVGRIVLTENYLQGRACQEYNPHRPIHRMDDLRLSGRQAEAVFIHDGGQKSQSAQVGDAERPVYELVDSGQKQFLPI